MAQTRMNLFMSTLRARMLSRGLQYSFAGELSFILSTWHHDRMQCPQCLTTDIDTSGTNLRYIRVKCLFCGALLLRWRCIRFGGNSGHTTGRSQETDESNQLPAKKSRASGSGQTYGSRGSSSTDEFAELFRNDFYFRESLYNTDYRERPDESCCSEAEMEGEGDEEGLRMHLADVRSDVSFEFLDLASIARLSGCSKVVCDRLLPPVLYVRCELLRQAQIRAERRELKAFHSDRDPDGFISDSSDSS